MSLTDSIDAALATAAASQAKPFRLELQPPEIQVLKDAGQLTDPPEGWATAVGGYRGVAVYEATRESELMAHPEAALLALHLPISI